MKAAGAFLLGLGVGTYAKFVRPRMGTWGCGGDDATRELPGDDIVGRPKYQQTHAVYIAAAPSAVWPRILELDDAPGGLDLEVASVEDLQHRVLKTPGFPEDAFEQGEPYASWALVLQPTVTGTKVLARFRSDFDPSPGALVANKYALEPVHFITERKMLLDLKSQIESGTIELG